MKALVSSGEEDWGSNRGWEFSAPGWLVERLGRAYLQRQGLGGVSRCIWLYIWVWWYRC